MIRRRLRVGIIGKGGIAKLAHLPSLSEIPEVEIIAACDINSLPLNKRCDEYGIEKRFLDYQDMCDSVELDAVWILIWPQAVKEVMTGCLKKGIATFVEKPPGLNAQEAKELNDLAHTNGCLTMVGFNRRFTPLNKEIKRKLLEESGSPVIQCMAEYHKAHNGDKPYMDCDSWFVDIIHSIDTLLWMGGNVQEIVSLVSYFESDYPNGHGAMFRFESGGIGLLTSSYSAGARIEMFSMHCRNMSAYIEPPSKAFIQRRGRPETELVDGYVIAGSEKLYKSYGYYDEDLHFVHCLLDGVEPEISMEHGVKVMEIVDYIKRGKGEVISI
jgi:predicted dehydrogenase